MNTPQDDYPATERLLYISLEPRPSYGGDFRHIRASIVRRAVSHVLNEDGTVKMYGDDRNATGYRHVYWAMPRPGRAVYAESLLVRGQFDAYGANPLLNERKPYGNELEYDCARVRQREATWMADAFAYLAKRRKTLEENGHVFDDTFADQARALALSLGIRRCIIDREPGGSRSLADTRGVIEFPLQDLTYHADLVWRRAFSAF